jgi:predicted RNA-binding protein associated with RNAse of E/G family
MTRESQHFQPGENIEIREVLRDKVWTIRPVTVIEDTDENLVSYLAPGTLIDYPVDVEHGAKCFSMWLSGDWELRKKLFKPPGLLRIAPQGEPFEVFASVLSEGGISSWYVNFQEPLRRTPQGFDTMDQTIDLVVASDFSSWQRRDEDELELATSMGVYSQADARRLRDNCASVEQSLKVGIVPWNRSWSNWMPPNSFVVP